MEEPCVCRPGGRGGGLARVEAELVSVPGQNKAQFEAAFWGIKSCEVLGVPASALTQLLHASAGLRLNVQLRTRLNLGELMTS